MISIQTPRLTLVPLTHQQLTAWSISGRKGLENNLQLHPCDWILEDFYLKEMEDALANFWIPMTQNYPLDFMWYTNWEIILTAKSCSIGGIGFSGLPDNENSTEIGYVIDQNHRRNGYAQEALKAMCDWAFQDDGLQIIRAETPVDNLASQQVLRNQAFQQIGSKTIHVSEPMALFTWERNR